ncbi:hypothetical protein N7451_010846 [Penicillium sp. IBT 35674x]|nr:hypothetical protein N7451_010846 [Penicillium sp. IBT 35674x]
MLEFLYTGNISDSYFPADGEIPGGDSVGGRNRHYQRARLYAEEDYFAIVDLKRRMMEEFRSSFFPYQPNGPLSASVRSQVDADTFAEIIKEIYSERADYRELRKVVIENLKEQH